GIPTTIHQENSTCSSSFGGSRNSYHRFEFDRQNSPPHTEFKSYSPHTCQPISASHVRKAPPASLSFIRVCSFVLPLLLLPDSDGDRTHIHIPTKNPHINSKRLTYKIAFDRFLRFSEPPNAPNPSSSNSSSLSKIAIEHNLQIAKILSPMGDTLRRIPQEANVAMTGGKNKSHDHIVASRPNASLQHITSLRIGNGAASQVALFLLKMAALETVRRFSRAKCPWAWRGFQALQFLCYPPFKWFQRFAPFKALVNGMQVVSKPLLVLSIATAFSDEAEPFNRTSDGINNSDACSEVDSEVSSECINVSTLDTRIPDEFPQNVQPEMWLTQLHKELETQGITLPERIDEEELRRSLRCVSQVEHGVFHLLDANNAQITVVLPPVLRVIAQTFIQVLKPYTREKLRIEGEMYRKILSEYLETLPSYLGGKCMCKICSDISITDMQQPHANEVAMTEQRLNVLEGGNPVTAHPTYEAEIDMDRNCDQVLRTAIVCILMIWVFIAFIAGFIDPESRPIFPK
ncbi:SEC14 cytosolic factor family protein / phosphoglyceride transfer family protein, partial [Prunus dulcis]